MKNKSLALSLLALLSQSSIASISSPSLFKEMQSTNPGVISKRSQRAFSMMAKRDVIEIKQDLSTGALGAGATFDAEVELTNYSAFYGGKGGGITLEVFGETGSGGRTNNLKDSTGTNSFTTESTLTNIGVGIGIFEGFGIGITKVAAEDKQQYNFTVNGEAATENSTAEYDLTAITAGFTFNLGLDFGLFYTKSKLDTKSSAISADDNDNSNDDRMGLGVGLSTKSLRAEVGIVKNVKSRTSERGSLSPTLLEFSVEGSLGKLKLGYTGRYFKDGFFLHRGILYNNLAYQTNTEPRLDNTFNFSYGNDSKGHSFSGSISIGSVESQEGQPIIPNNTATYKTTTDSKSFSLSYAYIF